MPSLLIRDIDRALLAALKRRAATEHRSVQKLVHEVLRTEFTRRDGPLDLIPARTGRRAPIRRTEIVGDDDRG